MTHLGQMRVAAKPLERRGCIRPRRRVGHAGTRADRVEVVADDVRNRERDRRAHTRRRKTAAPTEAKPSPVPNSPAEALDRIGVAPEAMARIAEVLTTGGSIIVSDLGVSQGGETGEGTDFIIPLR